MIKDKFKNNGPLLSFEVFPPKKEGDFANVYQVLNGLKDLNPAFISVTYGAGGSKSKTTVQIASYIQNELGIDALAHMTCVGNRKEDLSLVAASLADANISHLLALRGDRPAWMSDAQYEARDFSYATDMIAFLKANTNLHIAGACYPEKHFEAPSECADLEHLLEKVNTGCDFLISQLFFDNDCFYRFLDNCKQKGICVPICAGIMPIISAKQLGTTISLSGAHVPKSLADIIATYGEHPEDMRKAGLDFAIRQILDLKKHGVDGIHLYTMNKLESANEITAALAHTGAN